MKLVDERQNGAWTFTRRIQTWHVLDGYVVAWSGPAGRGHSRTWPRPQQAAEIAEWLMAAAAGEWWRRRIDGIWPL